MGHRGVSVDASRQSVDAAPVERAGGVLEQLDVLDAGEADAEVAVEGVGVVADVEKGFWDVGGLEDGFERLAVGALGGECCLPEDVDVDEVDVVLGEDEKLDDGDTTVTVEVRSFEVKIERGRGGR